MPNRADIAYRPVPDVTVPNNIVVSSPDLVDGAPMDARFANTGAGCGGENITPRLEWSNVPEGTKSIAITCFDPNAPTGSGFWHWIVADLPPSTTSFGPGDKGSDFPNDYGLLGYNGPCPPSGGPHNYIFTVHALGIEKLGLPQGATHTFARFAIHTNAIAQGTITGTYECPAT
ncbi:MAG: YbhB/YbcL family Raf kinase inhibitor-like protein [Actinomycetaceae bacterium]|nr:YbhB/YbcL family Raf kinase inhibitor-like protein [Actinomycetaceae bacterium]